MDDLREYAKELGKFYARLVIAGEHPALYLNHSQVQMIHGVREKDYLFSSDKKWVIAHDQMGLSFSAHWQHLKDKFKMKDKHAKGGEVNVYWLLEKGKRPTNPTFSHQPLTISLHIFQLEK